MTEKIQGKIEAVKQWEDRFGIRIGPNWYNSFGISAVEKGDEVEVEFESVKSKDGTRTFHNIKNIKKIEPETEFEGTAISSTATGTWIPAGKYVSNEAEKNSRCAIIVAKDLIIAKGNLPANDGQLLNKLTEIAKGIKNWIEAG